MARESAGLPASRKGKTAADAVKQQRAFELATAGHSLRQIAAQMTAEGTRVSHEHVRKLISAEAMERVAPVAAEYRAVLMARLDASRLEVLGLLGIAAPPVVAGKDGVPVRDPESGQWVRDYGPRLQAVDRLLKIDAELAKLVGAYAPTKTEAAVNATVTEVPADVAQLIEQARERNAAKRAELDGDEG